MQLQQHVITARYNIYYGNHRDYYDLRGRVAHESIFNINDGKYRCPSSQQGYSPFTTWTRGLAWIICGYAELLEFLSILSSEQLLQFGNKYDIESIMIEAARATSDFYIENSASDGIPYWDTGAPNLYKLGSYQNQKSNPFNDFESVDSSAAAIAAQGLLRLGHYITTILKDESGARFWQAGLTILDTLLSEPYISNSESHQGLLLHSVYHRPNGWDYIPGIASIPCGESSMWGDYHLREVALYVQRCATDKPYLTFYLNNN